MKGTTAIIVLSVSITRHFSPTLLKTSTGMAKMILPQLNSDNR